MVAVTVLCKERTAKQSMSIGDDRRYVGDAIEHDNAGKNSASG